MELKKLYVVFARKYYNSFFRVINKQALSKVLTLVQHFMLHEFLQYLLGEEAVGKSVLYVCSC